MKTGILKQVMGLGRSWIRVAGSGCVAHCFACSVPSINNKNHNKNHNKNYNTNCLTLRNFCIAGNRSACLGGGAGTTRASLANVEVPRVVVEASYEPCILCSSGVRMK